MKKFLALFTILLVSEICYAQIPDTTQKQQPPVDSLQQTQPVPPPPPPPPPAQTQPTQAPPAQTQPAQTTPPPSQEPQEQKRSFNEKFAFGLGAGFWITPGTTYVEVAPTLAYRFPKILITGIGFRYIYQHDRYLNNDLHSYGPLVFARVNVLKRVYLWTEYEYLFNQYFDENYTNDDYSRENNETDSWFAGLGYQQSLGKSGRGGISVQVLYNFLYSRDEHTPYYSAWTYRIGYFF